MAVRGWLRGFVLGFLVLAAPLACQAQRAESVPTIVDVTIAQLPVEARETIELIHKGGPYPYAKDGAVFGNREGVLPHAKRGYYREYTVKTPGVRTRGARRIVAGAGGELYYSDDHYNHFRRIRE
ncbi:MAG TPA: ribonuclease domain-containing protein [Usitatibacter sp.]|jgi:ribonuclease T1|nr:ribonuclease domain-containing protein [Usitatibacter sp.]